MLVLCRSRYTKVALKTQSLVWHYQKMDSQVNMRCSRLSPRTGYEAES